MQNLLRIRFQILYTPLEFAFTFLLILILIRVTTLKFYMCLTAWYGIVSRSYILSCHAGGNPLHNHVKNSSEAVLSNGHWYALSRKVAKWPQYGAEIENVWTHGNRHVSLKVRVHNLMSYIQLSMFYCRETYDFKLIDL